MHSSGINMFKNRMDNYFLRQDTLSLIQRLCCPQPSQLLVGWQPCKNIVKSESELSDHGLLVDIYVPAVVIEKTNCIQDKY